MWVLRSVNCVCFFAFVEFWMMMMIDDGGGGLLMDMGLRERGLIVG